MGIQFYLRITEIFAIIEIKSRYFAEFFELLKFLTQSSLSLKWDYITPIWVSNANRIFASCKLLVFELSRDHCNNLTHAFDHFIRLRHLKGRLGKHVYSIAMSQADSIDRRIDKVCRALQSNSPRFNLKIKTNYILLLFDLFAETAFELALFAEMAFKLGLVEKRISYDIFHLISLLSTFQSSRNFHFILEKNIFTKSCWTFL